MLRTIADSGTQRARADSFVKEKSEWVGPNLSLVFQLVAYERTLRGDSINGDDDLSEPPSAAFRSEHPSPRTQSDLPPASPLDVERPFAFAPPLSARPISRMVNGTLASPHTPVSDASLAYSQMSTPELRDPLLSPTLSSATKSSSVTSTPLSPERQYNHLRPTVRIVQSDGDENDQSRGGRLEETVLANENARKASHDRVESVFVLPVPPAHGVQDCSSPADLVSPTVAKYPPASIPTTSDRQGFALSAPAPNLSSSTSPFRSGLPVLAPVATSPRTTSAPALPSLQVTTEHLPSPFSPSSTTLSPLSGSTTSPPGRTPSSSSSHSHDGLLAQSHSGRRFGAGQSRSERRASHRRVCSDTIRVPTSLGFTSAATTPILSSGLPSSAGTTPRAGTPEVEVGPSEPR